MSTIGAYEAKTKLPELLRRVEEGESITITRHGVPIAALVPVGKRSREDARKAVEALKEFRQGNRLDGVTIRELIDEGRR